MLKHHVLIFHVLYKLNSIQASTFFHVQAVWNTRQTVVALQSNTKVAIHSWNLSFKNIAEFRFSLTLQHFFVKHQVIDAASEAK